MTKSKILIINTNYRIFGGEDSNIIDEFKFLKNKYNVKIINFSNKDKIRLLDLFSFLKLSDSKSNKEIRNVIHDFQPDVAYVHNLWFKANLGILKELKKNRIEIIHKIHNYRFDCSRYFIAKYHFKENKICPACGLEKAKLGIFNRYFPESTLKSLFLIYFSKKYFKILKNYKIKILVMSRYQKNYLKNLGIDSKKIYIYPNPVIFNKQDFQKYNPKSKSVVFVGRLESNKGIKEIIDSWNKSSMKNLELIIIGSGSLYASYKNKYESESIKFLGNLSNNEAKNYISKSRALVTATKLYEGQPRVLLEASSYAVPSIYPSFGGMDDFFPPDYPLSFSQFNYQNFCEKLEKLNDDNYLLQHSINLSLFIEDKFNSENIHQMFDNIIHINNE